MPPRAHSGAWASVSRAAGVSVLLAAQTGELGLTNDNQKRIPQLYKTTQTADSIAITL